jgi:GT2 family glycosyltransferase
MQRFLNSLRSKLFSPDSRLELWFRTQYHKIKKTKLYFHIQDFQARRSYYRWRKKDQNTLVENPSFENCPKVTFLISIHGDDLGDVNSTMDSIRKLTGQNWEIIVINPTENDRLSEEIGKEDCRIKVVHSDQDNLIPSISGGYLIFCEEGDLFSESLLSNFYQALFPDANRDVVYYDCEYLDQSLSQYRPFFKPKSLSPELLLSVNYLSRGFFRVALVKQILNELDPKKNLLALEYELACALSVGSFSITHIPKVLVSQSKLSTPDTKDTEKVVVQHLARQDVQNVKVDRKQDLTHFTWHYGNPSIAIIIPTRNNKEELNQLLNSIAQGNHSHNYKIIIVDNNSKDEASLAYYRDLQSAPDISIVPYTDPFNYSQAMNLGVNQSQSDLLLFLNDDMKVIHSHWLGELAQWAVRPEIGVVGTKLLRENRTIQHTGIILGLNNFAGHIYLNAPDHYNGLYGSVDWYRNYLALTGACQMVRREVFEEVGGYDEKYRLAFGDIDFCLKVHEHGYRNVYTPFASMYHYEGKSRGYSTPTEDILLGYERLQDYLAEGDPYFSPNLTYSTIPKCKKPGYSEESRLISIQERKKFYETGG